MVTVPRTAGFVPFERGDIEQSIGERFEQQVRRYPQCLALKGSGRRYTYKELNDCVNRIAWRMIDECGEAEQTVGLLFEQGTDIIACILAVLKAGKIWVPLPEQGQQRTKAILDDVDAHCILTNSRHLQLAWALSTPARRVINVQDLPVNMSALNPGIEVSPDRLAHILFTSGSTGRPKGVYNNHRNVLHSIMTHTDALAISSRDRLSQLSPCHFLAGLTAMLRALLNGAAVLVYDLRESGIDRLGDWLRDERITIYQSVPTVFRELMACTSHEQRFNSMRIVHLGGEEMLPGDVERFKQHFPSNCMLLHNLGSTEVSSYLQYFIAHDTLTPAQGVPAGFPVLDKQILLLDGHGHEVAPDEVGEIAVRSRYLALGYWGQSELTAERFRGHGDSRIYRTGDLGQATREGYILYRGRKDGQVKIHGQRVELGEVEAALAAHPSVKQAVAALRSNRRGEQRLVAYYTVSRRDEISPGQWRRFLESHLPAYMIPQSFMRLRAFPRTDSGKVDRRKLPAVAVAGEEGQATGPSSSLEEVLCELWAELLGLEHADVDSDFFELGADSLLTMRLVAALRSARRLDVPVRAAFEHSTPRKLALYLDSLHEDDEGAQSRILCLPRSGPTPLSYAQARMWMDSQLEPNSPHNNVVMALRLYGSLDLQALRRSLAELWRRHEVLRSTFSLIGGRPMQTFLPPDEFTLRVDDLRPLATGVKAKEMLDQVRREAARPFDLEHGPLLRVRLLRLGAEDHALQFTLHHIVTDGWSMGLLREELGAIYNAFSKWRASPLTRLPLQYADYAHWQRRYLEGDILERELVYWRAQLGDARLTLDIPTDHPRSRAISYRSAEHCFDVDPALLAGLKTLSARQGVTLFMTLLSAFNVLLMRYTGQEDICVGTPIVGRRGREFEGLIGFFVNTLVMRIDLSGEPSFRELLGRVRETALQAYAHQELPFERLVEDLLLQRDSRGRSPIGVLFALQNTPRRPLELRGIRSERLEAAKCSTRFDLTLSIKEFGGKLRAVVEYAAELFDEDRIRRMSAHFLRLLESIAADPECAVTRLSLLTEAERHLMLVQWNDTSRDYPSARCAHELFEDCVEDAPETTAVISRNERLSYACLNRRANRLAHYLVTLGVCRGTPVVLGLERDIDAIVAMLAVLKAGGAYVPLDPSYPQARLIFMLEDSAAPLLLTHANLSDRFSASAARVLCLDSERETIASQPSCDLPPRARAQDTAYVIYTSGSTGEPKGVRIPHTAVNRLVNGSDYISLNASDRIAQISNISFDAATFEIWGALHNGAVLVVFDRDTVLGPGLFAADLKRLRITTLFLTTALFNRLSNETPDAFSGLKNVLFGGETADPNAVRKVLSEGPPRRLLHVYGPTENTTFSTWHTVRSLDRDAATVPIGRPLANTRCYVLDTHLQPVPIGIPGELFLGGDGLALGYLNRDQLTSERFVSMPLGGAAKERLYRTGDMVRYLADGAIDFIGRVDQQVKIRGFRIELGEIESALHRHPGVNTAVVLCRSRNIGEKELIACCTANGESRLQAADIREHLKAWLPDYSVPAGIRILDSLPLTSNGKMDRQALANLALDDSSIEEPVQAESATESCLLDIWKRVLKNDNIGIDHDFFDIGGHSLLAISILIEVEQQLGKRLSIGLIFQNPTIRKLARMIDRPEPMDTQSAALLKENGSDAPFFCIHGNWHSLKDVLDESRPLYFLHHAHDKAMISYASVEDIAQTHVEHIQRVQSNGPYYIGGYSFGAVVAYEVARQLSAMGAEIESLVLIDPTKPRKAAGKFKDYKRLAHRLNNNLNRIEDTSNKLKHLKNGGLRFIDSKLRSLWINRKYKDLMCDTYRRIDKPLPPGLRKYYFSKLYKKAARAYAYPPYEGRISLFAPQARYLKGETIAEIASGWEKLARGGLDVHYVSGAAHHGDFFREPWMREFAEKLNACLGG